MKTFNQYFLLAASMLTAGVANAQTPTNQFTRAPRTLITPVAPVGPNAAVAGASAGTFAPTYGSYSQDSYIVQTGSTNYSSVDQQDQRTGTRAANSGSSAVISQTGTANNAFQNQTANTSSNVANGRSFLSSTQAGTASQSNQTQVGGYNNTALVQQGEGTSGNRAIQEQTGNGYDNGARITQTNAGGGLAASTGNRAQQAQTGHMNLSITEQQGQNSYASQTQSNYYNDAYIGQGAPGARNTAIQNQSGQLNNARIRQSVGTPTANNNYALQNQTGYGDQADIEQRSSNNFARQDQSGPASNYQNNNSSIVQENVASAAYTVQSGNLNTAIVRQH
jgi:hypothetical protein